VGEIAGLETLQAFELVELQVQLLEVGEIQVLEPLYEPYSVIICIVSQIRALMDSSFWLTSSIPPRSTRLLSSGYTQSYLPGFPM
jgi:hypothetical protein